MRPTNIDAGGDEPQKPWAAKALKRALGDLADVREPHEADEPILSPAVRAVLFEWLAEIRAGADLTSVGLKPRRTALLFGPPGCGKTTLAHHMAARLGIPLVRVGPETIFDAYIGSSERNIAGLFDKLGQANIPCILLLDELDAIGRARGGGGGGGVEVRDNVLTILLRKIEEFQGYAFGATNLAGNIDPALWRRFHMQIEIDLPGDDERWAIIKRYSEPFELSEADLDLFAELTIGASPALLRGLAEGMKRALVIGPRINRPPVDPVALFTRIVAGLKPPPEMAEPTLWASPTALDRLAGLSAWPPPRRGAAAA